MSMGVDQDVCQACYKMPSASKVINNIINEEIFVLKSLINQNI